MLTPFSLIFTCQNRNGYGILSELRKDIVAHRFVPILVFTADTTAETKARALDAGASDFLTKPGDVQEILCVFEISGLRQMQLKIEHTNKELEESIRVRTASLMTARREESPHWPAPQNSETTKRGCIRRESDCSAKENRARTGCAGRLCRTQFASPHR